MLNNNNFSDPQGFIVELPLSRKFYTDRSSVTKENAGSRSWEIFDIRRDRPIYADCFGYLRCHRIAKDANCVF